jgi:hypothetical protein
VDTFLGSAEHWLNPEWKSYLNLYHGYPSLYYTFLCNIIEAGVADYVVPIPLDSTNANAVVKHYGLIPKFIHVDGAHDYRAVTNDLELWWPLLSSGGYLVGDDYGVRNWPDVQRAFDNFFKSVEGVTIESQNGKCRIRKPSSL